MSLLNLIVQPDCAYIITDSGHYDVTRGGVVTRLGLKSMILEDQRLIVATAGELQCKHLAPLLSTLKNVGQDELVEMLPEIARAAVETFKIGMMSTVVFAGYSPARGSAFGGAFLTAAHGGPSPFPERDYQILARSALLLPPVPGMPLAPLSRPSAFNPYTNAMAIIEQQRRFDFSSPGLEVGCCITGDIDLVGVRMEGFEIETLHTYPATIGEKVALTH